MTLRLRGVGYTYAGGRQLVLDGIDLEVPAGRVVGLVGPADAGKSTLCLIAAGLAPGSIGGRLTGSVTLDGAETVELKPFEAAQRCGILFQNPLTQLSGTAVTVFEEIAFGPRNLGLSAALIAGRVGAALDALGIEALGPRDPLKLSGGQAQLVALASVLALEPKLLVLDEPTSQLDPAGTHLVGDALARLAAGSGTAVLIVEHKTGMLAQFAHEVVLLDGGRIVRRGATAAVLGDPALAAAGVQPPEPVSLQRALSEHGLEAASAVLDTAPGLHPPVLPPAARPRPVVKPPSTEGPLAIECLGVSFEYPGGTRALDGVDLAIAQGERVAIIGQNGSGKSTLVRQFNGLLRPLTGSVAIAGEPVGDRHVAEVARQVGLMFQNPDRQIFARLVRDEVAFGARNVGRRGSDLDDAVRASVEAVGLRGAEDTNPYDLGFSKRKLLALASVLSMGTPIVILDEPTTGQDARGVARIQAIIDDLAKAGRTVIAISHDMRFVAESFGRVVVMGSGRVLLDGPPAEVFAEDAWPVLASTYLEPPYTARVGARLGLGATPTEDSLLAALSARG
jgi:energy-coupling factor transport system ATP-binding protein